MSVEGFVGGCARGARARRGTAGAASGAGRAAAGRRRGSWLSARAIASIAAIAVRSMVVPSRGRGDGAPTAARGGAPSEGAGGLAGRGGAAID
ncbi:hypothetical protein Cch01nite_37890 [Cellulomonas chitinilytica]|uniref:Uncharacterized protein n=1 Tax=Cellulomonas chitinilytica TaxID=398759 RepID=A0A919P5F8_9CELL|nr:hypothetical protein Cch01nite_37890 [Cellulomonas chitinilytica]